MSEGAAAQPGKMGSFPGVAIGQGPGTEDKVDSARYLEKGWREDELPKKIFLNVSSDSTSWQIALAKSLSFLLSQLASGSLEYVSASEKWDTSS